MYYSTFKIDGLSRETDLGVDYDTIFDIDPLTGVDVDLATSQGYQQIGETVEGQSVGGINRTVKGVFYGPNAKVNNVQAQASIMLQGLPLFSTGKLYYYPNTNRSFTDSYFCNIYVKKTPQIYTDKNGITRFSILLYCPTPFWYKSWIRAYSLTKNSVTNCKNEGVAQNEFTITFRTTSTVHNFKITNKDTGQYLALNTRLNPNERIEVYRKGGRLYVEKKYVNTTEDVFAGLDEGSNLFEMKTGNNNLELTTTESANITATVEFYEPYMGVINATD